ncbi:MAG: hypothetical protein FWC40_03590 [Proteobacteria bacterium]|nr:hypothetical protein [Pseudomonadota bacterium]
MLRNDSLCQQCCLCLFVFATFWGVVFPMPAASQPHRASPQACDESFAYANALLRAENAYVRRQYAFVSEILAPIYEQIRCIDDPTALEIELLLGVASLEQGNEALADTYFLNVLRSESGHEIHTLITLPESSLRRIEFLRSLHEEELNKLQQRTPGVIVESLYVLAEKEQHHYWINFLPFGAGQFQMKRNGWGAFYASTQLLGVALSITGAGMVEYYRGESMTFSPQNYAHAKNWQNAQIVGIAILAASYVAGVIHALIIYESSSTVFHPPSRIQPDSISHRAAPFILQDGAGLTYGATF